MHFCFRQQNLGPVFSSNFIFLLLVTLPLPTTQQVLNAPLCFCVIFTRGSLFITFFFFCSSSDWWLLFSVYFVSTSHVNTPISLFHSHLPPLSFLFLLFFLPFPSSPFRSSPSSWTTLITGQKKLVTKESKQSCDFLGQLSKKCSRMFKK